tara:strand:+ start:505 stop:1302 length:798 start_codon:yes stop_codon:yes gene_type:complete
MELDLKNLIKFNITKRIFSTILALPIIFFCIFYGSFYLKILIILVSFLLSIEWFLLTQKKFNKEMFFFIFLIILNLFICFSLDFIFSVLLTMFFSLIYIINKPYKQNIWLFYGLLYICIPLLIFFKINNLENGTNIIIWFLITIWSTDTLSFLFGNLIKGPRIFPDLSPSKTYSGTIFGIFFGSIIGLISFIHIFNSSNNFFLFYLFSLLLSFSALIGDLIISKIKRYFNVKDSSKILPGHGGFLDRYDSISFGFIVLFFLVYFI